MDSVNRLRITYKTKPGIFDEKRGTAALLIKNSGFCFIFNPNTTTRVRRSNAAFRTAFCKCAILETVPIGAY